MSAQYNSAHQRQIDAQSPTEHFDPEQAEYEVWCDARDETAELEAHRDFLMQHKRVTGVLSGAFDTSPWLPTMATVQTDSFAEWTEWDKRTNFLNRERVS